ncbi:RapGAP/RanGAP domain-containing protein [Heterostelium album PN500]|uniref:GTPase-activating Rap/Ran-GAP domain-like protein 3 n=1 Tax=Heterostelium pallidum (strain ATCC 26659 / Pp 5 / PN500) TaxID=670386 RepID=D3AW95_HETP5|nr:RapGAP/RanGAP domain-containing protein [Heterostelium album PN500]EFA86568.1 RapGAP/RanGAP domain-containing protein [Heterostelium album PN500]|eukprot:XP_020438673.1 RapGAP/RanGAP domain-containing protein [Heterostelium album PN500]
MITPSVGYRIEGSNDTEPKVFDCSTVPNLLEGVFDLSDNDSLYFRETFLNRDHYNFINTTTPENPVCISIVLDKDGKNYSSLLRTSAGNQRLSVPADNVKASWWRRLFKAGPSPYDMLRSIAPQHYNGMKLIVDPALPPALMNLEEKQTIKGFKFGILYGQEGQTKEDEMFANVDSSAEFEEFLDFIGERVPLTGWPNFRAGLDVRTGTTGSHSIYQRWNNNEVMYHVSSMLPFNQKDKQQLERKRHIGNDIVVVVFQDGDTVYRPTTISSRQVHVVLVVKAVKVESDPGQRYYRLAVVSKDSVPEFGPPMPQNGLFKKDQAFKDFFYAKLLNAEKASYSAPILEMKLSRTRKALLKDVSEAFC